jgi:hypothetical protein
MAEPIEIGHYGAGTLSVLTNDARRFILLGALTMAWQSEETGEWLSIAPGWKVSAEGGSAVRVQFGDGEGVVVSLP